MQYPRSGTARAAARERVSSSSPSLATLKIAGCAVAVSMALGDIVRAQDEPDLEQVTVTGSRIQRDGLTTATPVTAIDQDEMRNMAPTLLMDAIDTLPQFRNNDLSQTGGAFASAGANSVNLRGIGTNRTLVLLDGRRVVSSTKNGTVDIALLPQPLVERVEVVTGGASAAYGSDAVSGVTNFILNTDMTGFEASVQTGATDLQDRQNSQIQVAGGFDVGDRSHIVVSADGFAADEVIGYRGRDWFESWGMVNNPDFDPANPEATGPERLIMRPCYSLAVSLDGIVPSGPLAGTKFDSNGNATQVNLGEFVNPGLYHCGENAGGEDVALDYGSVFPEEDRWSTFLHWDFDANDQTRVYAQLLRGKHTVSQQNIFGNAAPWNFTIQRDNAFLPESLRQHMDDEDIDSFPMGRQLTDVYRPRRTSSHDLTSFTAGFERETDNGMLFSTYYQYGETVQLINYAENNMQVRTDRLYRAIDAVVDPDTGSIVCNSTLNGISPEQEANLVKDSENGVPVRGDPLSNSLCEPMNVFGWGSPSQAARDYTQTGTHHVQDVTQHFIEATIQAPPFDNWAGEISLLGGASYRDDEVFQQAFANDIDPRRLCEFATFDDEIVGYRGLPDVVVNEEVFQIGNPNADCTPIEGGFDVTEVFAETYVPLYRGDSGRYLDMTLGLRHAEYSGSGGVWAGKLGLDWQATSDLRFRATASRDTRAGTLSERFDSQGAGANVDDPFNPDLDPYLTTVVAGGNPEVDPEEADTITFGLVYQPSWASGLGISIDAYDIKLDGAISQLGIQAIADECFAGAVELCELIDFNEAGEIQVIRDVFINVAEARTRGVDLEIQYSRPVDWFGGGENVRVRAFANYIDEASEQNVGAPKLDQAGSREIPEEVGTVSLNYSRGPLGINVQQRYISSSVRDVRWETGVDISNNHVSGTNYTDLQLSYDWDAPGGNYRFFAHVTNLFDEPPVLTPTGPSTINGTTGHTLPGQFDVLGRRYVVGVDFNFGQ